MLGQHDTVNSFPTWKVTQTQLTIAQSAFGRLLDSQNSGDAAHRNPQYGAKGYAQQRDDAQM